MKRTAADIFKDALELYSGIFTIRFVKRDVVLWLKHLHEAGMPVPSGCSAVFRVGDADITVPTDAFWP